VTVTGKYVSQQVVYSVMKLLKYLMVINVASEAVELMNVCIQLSIFTSGTNG